MLFSFLFVLGQYLYYFKIIAVISEKMEERKSYDNIKFLFNNSGNLWPSEMDHNGNGDDLL